MRQHSNSPFDTVRTLLIEHAIKKGSLRGPLLRISSVLDAYDAGSPHIVFWTVCSPGACPTLFGLAAATDLIRRVALDAMSGQ